MVVAEFKKAGSTVRVHDEFCQMEADSCILQLGRIVSESYKRRQLSGQPREIAAANMSASPLKL